MTDCAICAIWKLFNYNWYKLAARMYWFPEWFKQVRKVSTLDFTYSLPDEGTNFRVHSDVRVVDEGYIRPVLSYTSNEPMPCVDIVFIGFNPSKAGIPGNDGMVTKEDNTVGDVLCLLARKNRGEFETSEPRIVTVTFCNLFAFAKSKLDDYSGEDLYAEDALNATRKVLESNPGAFVICGWGLSDFMGDKSDSLWKNQISALISILKKHQCYRIEKVNEDCEPFEARSWSRLGLSSRVGLKPMRHLDELKRFTPESPPAK